MINNNNGGRKYAKMGGANNIRTSNEMQIQAEEPGTNKLLNRS